MMAKIKPKEYGISSYKNPPLPPPKPRTNFNPSANPDKPNQDLRLADYPEDEAYNLIETYLFDKELCTKGTKTGVIYKPGQFMYSYQPDLEQFLIPETDEIYITLSNGGSVDIKSFNSIQFGKTKYASIPPTIIMNPDFMKRINRKSFSNNQYNAIVLKREIIEAAINNLKEEQKAIIIYFLCPGSTLQSKGISKKVADKITNFKQKARVLRLEKAIYFIIDEIVIFQEKLLK